MGSLDIQLAEMLVRPTRVLVLGGGFGGVYTALHLERALGKRKDIEITLVSRENFFLFTPMRRFWGRAVCE